MRRSAGRNRIGQAMVEFALVLPLAILLSVYSAGVVALSVEVASFQKDALADLAAGASSSRHVYQLSVALWNGGTGSPPVRVSPGQTLGATWTHILASGPGPLRCLAMTSGGVEFRTGPLCPTSPSPTSMPTPPAPNSPRTGP
jgi:hypothetical protein